MIMSVTLTGCNQQPVNVTHETSIAESGYSSFETSSLFTTNIIDIDNKLEHNSTAMTSLSLPIAEIDINFDGICEDFFISLYLSDISGFLYAFKISIYFSSIGVF